MALRICNKINSAIVQNLCRRLSSKTEALNAIADNKKHGKQKSSSEEDPEAAKPLRYSLGQQQSMQMNKKFSTQETLTTDVQDIRKTIAEQNLQPSMLPNYFENPIRIASPFSVEDAGTQEGPTAYRTFEPSKTYARVTLPLKQSKLANPFPEPVKVMQSHTVSDEEKAAQAFADSRSTRTAPINLSNMNQTRHFSTSSALNKKKSGSRAATSGKCKLKEPKKAKTCRKMKLPGCEPPKRKTCKRKPTDVKCKKQEAPYPSYSESCHEPLILKPSECRMCPWKPRKHPYFKQKKKNFHTTVFVGDATKGAGNSRTLGVIPEGKQASAGDPKQLRSGFVENTEYSVTDSEVLRDPTMYYCDLKKDQAEEPRPEPAVASGSGPNTQSKPSVTVSSPTENLKNVGITPTNPVKKTQGWTEALRAWNCRNNPSITSRDWVAVNSVGDLSGFREEASHDLRDEPGISDVGIFARQKQKKRRRGKGKGKGKGKGSGKSKKNKNKRGKCKKFPFQKCQYGKKRKKNRDRKLGECPPKKKRKLVKDCPPEKDGCKKGMERLVASMFRSPSNLSSMGMVYPTSVTFGSCGFEPIGPAKPLGMYMRKKKKCPTVDLNTRPMEDRCKKKKKQGTQICPKNLTQKKRRLKYRGHKNKKSGGSSKKQKKGGSKSKGKKKNRKSKKGGSKKKRSAPFVPPMSCPIRMPTVNSM